MPRALWTWRGWVLGLTCAAISILVPVAPTVRAAGATIAVTPTANVPHGAEQLTGSGFDPMATVAIGVTSSTGTTRIATLSADAGGSVAGTIILPLALDATVANTITAQQVSGAVTASTTLAGLAVEPMLGNGAQISARLGDVLSVRAVGFAPLDPITVTVGGALVTPLPEGSGEPVSDPAGTLNVSFAVPAGAQTGSTQIVATGSAAGLGQTDRTTLPINIVGSEGLIATPNPAPAGHIEQIRGSGYAPDEPIAVTLIYTDTLAGATDEASLAANANNSGNLDASLAVPPTAAAGSMATLTAHGERSGLNLSVLLPLLGRPTLSISPPGAPPGSVITLTGSNFQPGERVLAATSLFSAPSGGFVADAGGSFSATATLRDGLASGMYDVSVSGINGDQAIASVTIPPAQTPVLQTAPGSVMPGDSITVHGARFLAHEPVQLSLNTLVITPTEGPIVTGALGDFSATIRVPDVAASGEYALAAQGLRTGATGSMAVRVRLPAVSHLYFAEGYTGQGPLVNFGESLDLLNTNPITTSGQIEYFLDSGPAITVPITIPAHAKLVEDVSHDVGAGHQVSALVEADHTITATRTITRTTVGGTALSASRSGGEANLSQFWYFAEGYTGVSFQEYVALFNPGDAPASVTIQPAGTAGSSPPAPIARTVPPRSRISINLRAALPNRALGLLVQANQPIAAERTLYWGAGAGSAKYGAAVSGGVQGPQALWIFPYVSTVNGNQAFVSVINPTTVEAHVRIDFYGDVGILPSPLSATVQPGSRVTMVIPAGAGGSAGSVSMVASSDVQVVAEEAQYFGGSPNIGNHAGSILAGSIQPSNSWIFPGSDTSNYATEQWYVLNTGSTGAHLTATLYNIEAQPREVHFQAGPNRLTSISLADIRDLQNESSSVWNSDRPVTIVQVLRGADPGRGAVITGSASS